MRNSHAARSRADEEIARTQIIEALALECAQSSGDRPIVNLPRQQHTAVRVDGRDLFPQVAVPEYSEVGGGLGDEEDEAEGCHPVFDAPMDAIFHVATSSEVS